MEDNDESKQKRISHLSNLHYDNDVVLQEHQQKQLVLSLCVDE